MTEARLNQIEHLVAQNAEAIAAHTATLDRGERLAETNTAAIGELRLSVNALVQIVELHQRDLEASQRNFDIIVNEIRGLRTESQRILEYLFSCQGNGS